MKTPIPIPIFLVLLFLVAFKNPNPSCENAISNLEFAHKQTQLSKDKNKLNMLRYHAYKALNAIEKTKDQLAKCGCEEARELLLQSLTTLKNATKAENLDAARILITEAGYLNEEGLEELRTYNHKHGGTVTDSRTEPNGTAIYLDQDDTLVYLKYEVDTSLKAYEASLEDMVKTVDCAQALEFAQGVYTNAENELLRPELSEGKRYFNLRVKEITEKALEQLKTCQ